MKCVWGESVEERRQWIMSMAMAKWMNSFVDCVHSHGELLSVLIWVGEWVRCQDEVNTV